MDDLERRLALLEQRVEGLERQNRALLARADIEKLMSRYQHYYAARRSDRILSELWAQQRPDISVEDRFYGVYEGFDGPFPDAGLRTYYASAMNFGSPGSCPGKLTVCTATTQMLEIAGDLETAKGVWISIGLDADAGELASGGIGGGDRKRSGNLLSMRTPEGERYMADWVWQTYGVDFIREDDGWKLWHLHIYDLMRCPYDEDWVSYSRKRAEQNERLGLERSFTPYGKPAGHGVSYHWEYTIDAFPPLEPRPPEPYAHFSDTFRY